jgi:3-hydroxyacyl-CoA dehydrogenase
VAQENKGRIAIIGAGFIGRAWAIVFARAGYEARLYDAVEGAAQKALSAIDDSLADLKQAELIGDAVAIRARITACGSIPEALDGAIHAQENVWEQRDLKLKVFAEMDAAAGPDTVLASSSSAIPASEYTADLKGRARCLVAHPGNPPYLLPVVELVPSPWTAPAVMDRTYKLFESVGQVPVRLKREIAGFVMNRLQAGVVCEAMSLVGKGVISPEDLDKVMRHSLGLRWSFMGPFETMDLNAPNGFQDYLDRYRIPYQKMGLELGVADPWTKEASDAVLGMRDSKTPRANLPARRRWRDRRLMALRRQIAQADREIGG